ncbi:MAG: methionine--tRNA ligase [Candidatus Parcubacteria bacterium]|nr:MAG: methionine--tRNA ligase [Candidatus Parcubacteria bacterium]
MIKKIFIGTAWPYVNGDLHVGHLAGYLIPADIFSRFCRLKGYETLMVSGTDCHGTPITIEADKRKISPQDLVAEYTPKVLELIQTYQITYDLFTSTTTDNHKKITQEFFLNLLNKGYISRQKSYQYFSLTENKFLPDRYVEGECKHCQAKEQRGDQCENCGRSLEPGELINPKSKLTGSSVILKETEHYFLDYSKLQKQIENFVFNSNHWRKWVYNESVGYLKEGLRARAITRDIDWGIEIPKNKISTNFLIDNIEHKRFYVWFEAVIGYFSASVEWAKKNNKDWEDFWLDSSCRHYYFMGKDNLIFHTIFWPGQLIGQEKGYNLPYFPAVNNFLLLEGKKFSKSRGIHIDSLEIAKKYGVENVRFYIASILPENKDADFKWQEFKETINNELVDKIGNFIHRVLIFFQQKLNQKIENENLTQEVLVKTEETLKLYQENLEKCEMVKTFNLILDYVNFANQYLDKNEPWKLLNENKNKCEEIIFSCFQIINNLRILLWPFIPQAMEKLSQFFNLKIETKTGQDNFVFGLLRNIKLTQKPEPLFKKLN